MNWSFAVALSLLPLLSFAAEPKANVKNLDFSAGLDGWRNAYPETTRAEVEDGRLKLTAVKAGGTPGGVVQYFKVAPDTPLVFAADVETEQGGFAFLNVKLNKNGKETASLNASAAKPGKSRLELAFNTGDADTAAILCRIHPGEKMLGKSAVFGGLTLKEENRPKILLAGDSTVENCNPALDRAGWGQMLPEFCTDGVKVVNLAAGGRSTKSFVDEKRWDGLLAQLSPGDVVLIQFGHNDQKKDRPAIYADAENDYQNYLKRFIADVRARKGEVILCTSVVRRIFDGAKIRNTLETYPAAARKVGAETGVPVIDLYRITEALLEEYGPDKSAELFYIAPDNQPDRSHFNRKGAQLVAEAVAREIKTRKLPGAEFIR